MDLPIPVDPQKGENRGGRIRKHEQWERGGKREEGEARRESRVRVRRERDTKVAGKESGEESGEGSRAVSGRVEGTGGGGEERRREECEKDS